jgi:hypothetical protein
MDYLTKKKFGEQHLSLETGELKHVILLVYMKNNELKEKNN